MMLLKIDRVENPKDKDNRHGVEKVYFHAKAGAELGEYLLHDATFSDDDSESNKGRHAYRFPSFYVEEDCTIVLWIQEKDSKREGDETTFGKENKKGHRFYWNRKAPLINNTGDTLTLIRIEDEQVFEVPPVKK